MHISVDEAHLCISGVIRVRNRRISEFLNLFPRIFATPVNIPSPEENLPPEISQVFRNIALGTAGLPVGTFFCTRCSRCLRTRVRRIYREYLRDKPVTPQPELCAVDFLTAAAARAERGSGGAAQRRPAAACEGVLEIFGLPAPFSQSACSISEESWTSSRNYYHWADFGPPVIFCDHKPSSDERRAVGAGRRLAAG